MTLRKSRTFPRPYRTGVDYALAFTKIVAAGLHARFWRCNFSATKLAVNCVTKIACVNDPLVLDHFGCLSIHVNMFHIYYGVLQFFYCRGTED